MKDQNKNIPIIDDRTKTKEEILAMWDEMETKTDKLKKDDDKKITV